ncbi:unnamed protein product [Camellia sinensis]
MEKLKVLHTAGSKAFRKVQYDERDCATGKELGLIELHKKKHFSKKKEAWAHADAEIRHDKAIEDGFGRYLVNNFLLRYLDKKVAAYEAQGVVENQVQHYLKNVPVPNSREIMRLLQGRLKSNEESMRSWWKEFKSWSPIAWNAMPKSTS